MENVTEQLQEVDMSSIQLYLKVCRKFEWVPPMMRFSSTI